MGASPRPLCLAVLAGSLLPWPRAALGESVAVRFEEGLVHGFLVLGTLGGERLAHGDLIQTVRGDRVTSRVVFHFDDGSVHDETAVFSQRDSFRLISSRLVQKGPVFPQPIEVSIEVGAGKVSVRHEDDEGRVKAETMSLDLPPDLANGLIFVLLKNLPPQQSRVRLSFLAASPEPRLVELEVTTSGQDAFTVGGSRRQATRYTVHVDIGGIAGFIAPILGKQPEDSTVWILEGEAPAFVRFEGPLYPEGPLWRIELTRPVWPAESSPPER